MVAAGGNQREAQSGGGVGVKAVALAMLATTAVIFPGCAAPPTEWASTTNSPQSASVAQTESAILPPPIIPMPAIPVALRGCWRSDDPDLPEPQKLQISGTEITLGGRVARPDYIQQVTPTTVHGLFSSPDGDNRATVATSLRLEPGARTTPMLVLQEGDAGSYLYRRC